MSIQEVTEANGWIEIVVMDSALGQEGRIFVSARGEETRVESSSFTVLRKLRRLIANKRV
jgi:hypothetical protein